MAIKKLNIIITGATSAVASVATNKFNKSGFIALTFDDGSPGHLVAQNLFSNLSFTDGCGNNIKYACSVAVNSDSASILGANGINNILSERGDIENHGFGHGNPSRTSIEDLNQLHNYVLSTYKYKMSVCDVPNASSGFGHASYLAGYNCVISANDTTFDEFQSVRVHRVWTPLATPYQFLAIVRDFSDDWDISSQVDFLKGECLAVKTGSRKFEFIGTHSKLDTPQKVAGFTDLFTYICTTIGDSVGVSTIREITDFRRMQVMPITQNFTNGILTVEIDVQDSNQTLRWSDISFNVNTNGSIVGVIGDGFDSTSFNPSTGLVNGFKQTTNFNEIVAPEPTLKLKAARKYVIVNTN